MVANDFEYLFKAQLQTYLVTLVHYCLVALHFQK